jgi:hypothetical protein
MPIPTPICAKDLIGTAHKSKVSKELRTIRIFFMESSIAMGRGSEGFQVFACMSLPNTGLRTKKRPVMARFYPPLHNNLLRLAV